MRPTPSLPLPGVTDPEQFFFHEFSLTNELYVAIEPWPELPATKLSFRDRGNEAAICTIRFGVQV